MEDNLQKWPALNQQVVNLCVGSAAASESIAWRSSRELQGWHRDRLLLHRDTVPIASGLRL